MGRISRTIQGIFGCALISMVLLIFSAAAVDARDGIIPYVGYQTGQLNTNDSVIFRMQRHSSIKVEIQAVNPGSNTQVVLDGTTAQDNNTFQRAATLPVFNKGHYVTSNHWQRSKDCEANACPKIKFTCTNQQVKYLKVLEVTPLK